LGRRESRPEQDAKLELLNLLSPPERRTLVKKLALRFLFGFFLILASIRDYLFGNGLYIYRDWSWPLSSKLTPVAVFSPNVLRNSTTDPFGFTRLFLTWPIAIINDLIGNFVLSEKIFVLYLFSIMILLSFVLAELLLRLLRKSVEIHLSLFRGELFSLIVVSLSFANFWSLQQLSDLYYTSFIEFMLTSISIATILLRNADSKSILLCGGLLSLGTFLDPGLSVFGAISVSLVILVSRLQASLSLRSVWVSAKRVAAMLVVTLPSLLTMLYVIYETSGTNLRSAGTYESAITNLSLPNAMRLLGYWWSLIVYAPPSILSENHIQQLPSIGSPPFMVLPQGLLTIFWLATTWSLPAVVFSSLLFSAFRKVTIPVSLVAFIGLLMTQPQIFPFPYLLVNQLKDYPLVGGALVTVFAVPDHILMMVASAYVVLAAVTLYALLTPGIHAVQRSSGAGNQTSSWRLAFKTFKNREVVRGLFLILILTMLIFPSWQLFSGSFYPSGYVDGGVGNGVSNVGAFSPSQPPQAMIDVYDWLLGQPGHFNVYWPGPGGGAYSWTQKTTPSITSTDAPSPTFLFSGATPTWFPTALDHLLSSNLTADAKAYLAALNVRYLVVQPMPPVSMLSAWGVEQTSTLNAMLSETNGIDLALANGDLRVYEINDTWGSVYSPNLIAGYASRDHQYALAYNLFSPLGMRIALVEGNSAKANLCFDTTECAISVLSPSYLWHDTSQQEFDALNQANITQENLSLNQGSGSSLPQPWPRWLVTNWGPGEATLGYEPGFMTWTFGGRGSTLSLSYNGTVTDDHPGGVAVRTGWVPEVSVSFSYRTSDTFTSSMQIAIPILNKSLATVGVPTSGAYPPSHIWQDANFTIVLPSQTAYFTSRIQTSSQVGWVQIRNVQLRINFFKFDPSAPFGYSTLSSINLPKNVGPFLTNFYLEYRGNGTALTSNGTYSLTSPNAIAAIQLPPSPSLAVSGNLSIAAIIVMKIPQESTPHLENIVLSDGGASVTTTSSANIVYARLFARGYTLKGPDQAYLPNPTMDGMNVFLGVNAGRYDLSFSALGTIQVTYLASLFLILGIISLALEPSITKRLREGGVLLIRRLRSTID
jgi:hypothetical protein